MEKELNYEQTKSKALSYLSFRSHSEKELKEKLKRAGAREDDIEDVVKFLAEYKFLDDEKYAISKALDMQNLKKFGRLRIEAELKMLGISADFIQNALAELKEDEEEMLLPLVKKKLSGNFEKKNIDKAIRYFAMRGYEFSDIKKCIEILKTER